MKPMFEQVPMGHGSSCSLLWRELAEIPFVWHYHPEFELTLTLNAQGQRYVGDHLGDFGSGDLVLVGPNMPHTWSARHRLAEDEPMRAAVVWFTAAWMDRVVEVMPELSAVQRLLREASGALQFSADVAAEVAPMLVDLQGRDETLRSTALLEVLVRLSRDRGARALATPPEPMTSDAARERLRRILDRLHERWTDPPAASELAALASLSVGAFHRFFKRHTGTTVLDYVTRLRIGQACRSLIETDRPVALIASEVGYASLAQFNLQFRHCKGMTPTALRRAYRRSRPS